MKRKKLTTVLGCILTLAILVGIAVPFVGRADNVELKVLNPKGELDQIVNMPLTDRQPLLDKLENGEDIDLLLLWYEKAPDTHMIWGVGLILKDYWEAKYDVTVNLIPIVGALNANNTRATDVGNHRTWQEEGTPAPVGSPWGPKTGKNHIDSQELSEDPFDRYQSWAVYDAVLFGTADCNVCTWWSSYHAKVIESLGTPVAVITNDSYESTQFYGAQDNGFTRSRRVVIDFNFWAQISSQAGGFMGAAYLTEATAASNNGVNLLRNQLPNAQPTSQRLTKRTVDDLRHKSMYMDNDIYMMATKTILEQAEWALLGSLTQADRNPPPVPLHERGDISCVTGINADDSYIVGSTKQKYLTFTGSSYDDVVWKFNEAAAAMNFADGVPLVPPTQELVDEMLAGTTRQPGDVLGKMHMRGGFITVEKLATNAVMAGCKPEWMPVLIAAAEGLGNAWEEDFSWWHPMTSGSSDIVMSMFVSGPMAKEIGMSFDVGQNGAGNEVNNAIGRCLRLLFLNIAHNMPGHIDTAGYKRRINDITLNVFAENIDALPADWVSHSELAGFGEDSSCIILLGATTANVAVSPSNAYNANWSLTTLANYIPRNYPDSGMSGYSLAVTGYSPAQARLLAQTYPTKEALIAARQPVMETGTHAGANVTSTLGFPIVLGGDPGGAYQFSAGYYLANTYHVQKITGATLTTVCNDATAPSAPQNFNVNLDADKGIATLTWDAPVTDGGRPITGYQVYYFEGGQDLAHRWLDVPGGTAARDCYFTNLLPGVQYFFKVRAKNDVDNARYYINSGGDGNMGGTKAVCVYAKQTPLERTAGKGGWACWTPLTMPGRITVLNANNYPQLNGEPIKLWYTAPVITGNYNTSTGEGGTLSYPTEKLYGPLVTRSP